MSPMRRLRVEFPNALVFQAPESLTQYEKLIYFGQISARLQQTTASAQQFVYFSGLIAAAIVSAGMVGHQPLIVILAPYALTFALTYQVQLYTDVECLTTLKEHLEKILNLGGLAPIYLEGTALSPSYRNRLSVRVLQVIYIALIVGVFVQSIRTSYKHQTRWTSSFLRSLHISSINLHVINVAGIVVCTVLLAITSLELVFVHDATQKRIDEVSDASLASRSDQQVV